MKGGENMNIVINSSADVSHTLPKVMKINNHTTTSLGNSLGFVQSYISKLNHGKANIQFDAVQRLLEENPKQSELLAIDVASQLTGTIPPIANGDMLEDDVRSYAGQLRDEIEEFLTSMDKSSDELRAKPQYVTDKRDPADTVDQGLDVQLVLQTMLASYCQRFGFNLQSRLEERKQLWKARRFIK